MQREKPRRLRRIDRSASRMVMKEAILVHLNVHLRTRTIRMLNRHLRITVYELYNRPKICSEIPVT